MKIDLKKQPHFQGLSEQALKRIAELIKGHCHHYDQGAIVCLQGERLPGMGLVISGQVVIERYDISGYRQVLTWMNPGNVFGEVFAVLDQRPVNVTVMASQPNCVIGFLPMSAYHCSDLSVEDRHQLMANLMRIMAERNFFLNQKLNILSQRQTREKLIQYFTFLVMQQAPGQATSPEIILPFGRQDLADFLCVDRAAMIKEMQKLQREGLIQIQGRKIRIKDVDSGRSMV